MRATTNRGKPRQSILSPSLSSSSGSKDGDADEVVATRRKKLALERRNLDEGAFGGGDTAKNAGRGGNAAEDDGRDSEGPIADGDGFDAGSDVEVESGASNRRASTKKESSRKTVLKIGDYSIYLYAGMRFMPSTISYYDINLCTKVLSSILARFLFVVNPKLKAR